MPDFIDCSVLGDLDTTFTSIATDEDVLLQDVYKHLTTPAGSCFWAPERTLDLRDYLNDSVSTQEIAELSTRIESLFEEDQRMDVYSDVAYSAATRTLTVTATVTAKTGTYTLVLTEGESSVTMERV